MTKETYIYWLSIVFFANTFPHLFDGLLCLLWRDMVKRTRLRIFFALAATFFFLLFIIRIVTLTAVETSFLFLLSISVLHTFANFFKLGVFATMTMAIRKRDTAPLPTEPKRKTSKILEVVRDEFKTLLKTTL